MKTVANKSIKNKKKNKNTYTKTYRLWISIKSRRRLRGDKLCEEWEDYSAFENWYNSELAKVKISQVALIRKVKSESFNPDNCFLGSFTEWTANRHSWKRSLKK